MSAIKQDKIGVGSSRKETEEPTTELNREDHALSAKKKTSQKDTKMKETNNRPPRNERTQHFRADDPGSDWIDALRDVFTFYDAWRGEANAPEQVAKYVWDVEATSERLVLTVSHRAPALKRSYRVTLEVAPVDNLIDVRTLYGSDFTDITIKPNHANGRGATLVHFVTDNGSDNKPKKSCELLLSSRGGYQMRGGDWEDEFIPMTS